MSQTHVVALLTHVEIEMFDSMGEVEQLAFDIVPDAQADYYAGYLGEGTPLAKAIMGCRAGNMVVYKAGDEACKVRILAIQPAAQPGDAASGFIPGEARRAAVQQAREQIAKTDAMIFASTVEGKWGEYDTSSLERDDNKPADLDHPKSDPESKS